MLHDLHNDLAFSPIKLKIEKIEKPTANLNDKEKHKTNIKSWISFAKNA